MKALGAGASIMASMGRFCLMFFGSAGIGIVTALVSALVSEVLGIHADPSIFNVYEFFQLLKFVNLHNTPSLEYGFLLLFAYLPYGLAEAINLSGMTIYFLILVDSDVYVYSRHNGDPFLWHRHVPLYPFQFVGSNPSDSPANFSNAGIYGR